MSPGLVDLRAAIERIVSDAKKPDLSFRQTAVLLFVRDEPKEHRTVRGMAAHLNISKPAVTRAIDRLEELKFVTRQVDKADRRSVLVRMEPAGRAFAAILYASSETTELAA